MTCTVQDIHLTNTIPRVTLQCMQATYILDCVAAMSIRNRCSPYDQTCQLSILAVLIKHYSLVSCVSVKFELRSCTAHTHKFLMALCDDQNFISWTIVVVHNKDPRNCINTLIECRSKTIFNDWKKSPRSKNITKVRTKSLRSIFFILFKIPPFLLLHLHFLLYQNLLMYFKMNSVI